MKTAVKILNILTMVSYVLGAISFIVVGIIFLSMPTEYNPQLGIPAVEWEYFVSMVKGLSIVFLLSPILFAISFVLCFIADRKFAKVDRGSDILGWCIVVLVFINLITGILMIIYDEKKTQPQVIETSNVGSNNEENIVENLKKVKDLYDSGLISEEEYNEKRKKYLDKL